MGAASKWNCRSASVMIQDRSLLGQRVRTKDAEASANRQFVLASVVLVQITPISAHVAN